MPMKRTIKKLAVVVLYLLILCFLLEAKTVLLFSPKHIGMFLLGCVLLCIPYLEKDMKWKGVGSLFKKNTITAGYLETFMLIFASMAGKEVELEALAAEIALDLRPLFYGFVCYMLLKEEEEPYKREEKKSRENFNEIKVEPDLSKLTRQEKIIAEMIKQGLSNREIGEELYISESTVKKHVSNIFAKLGISSRKEL
ncbi:hypothetical protein C819_01169 [Lachnospiraceae bacterium 10-1]|nr:hypothetical protein C819_01169 [Lachnospiraceae bacterium 10-1]